MLEDSDDRQTVDVKLDKNRKEKVPLYLDGESVKGQVTIRPKDGKRLEHTGIKVQFIGTIGASAYPPFTAPVLTDAPIQKCSSIAETTMNFYRWARS